MNVRRAAQSADWAAAVLFYTLLDHRAELREQQLLQVAQNLGSHVESQVRSLLEAGGKPGPEQRLPLLELAFPALKRHPAEYTSKVLACVQALVAVDGRVDIFEYLLSRITLQHVWAAQSPSSVRLAGNRSLTPLRDPALRVLAILAAHGNVDAAEASAAFEAGAAALGFAGAAMPDVGNWPHSLDADLPVLDRLAPGEKQNFLAALVTTVMKDGKAVIEELELLRAVCDLLHMPLPMMSGRRG
jgi:hypothetical protein